MEDSVSLDQCLVNWCENSNTKVLVFLYIWKLLDFVAVNCLPFFLSLSFKICLHSYCFVQFKNNPLWHNFFTARSIKLDILKCLPQSSHFRGALFSKGSQPFYCSLSNTSNPWYPCVQSIYRVQPRPEPACEWRGAACSVCGCQDASAEDPADCEAAGYGCDQWENAGTDWHAEYEVSTAVKTQN